MMRLTAGPMHAVADNSKQKPNKRKTQSLKMLPRKLRSNADSAKLMWTIGSHSKHTLSLAIYFLIRLTAGPSQWKCFLRRHHGINIAYVTMAWAWEWFLRNHNKHQIINISHEPKYTAKLPWTNKVRDRIFCFTFLVNDNFKNWSRSIKFRVSKILLHFTNCFQLLTPGIVFTESNRKPWQWMPS